MSRQNNYELFANVFSNLPTPAFQIFLNFYEIFVKIFVKTKNENHVKRCQKQVLKIMLRWLRLLRSWKFKDHQTQNWTKNICVMILTGHWIVEESLLSFLMWKETQKCFIDANQIINIEQEVVGGTMTQQSEIKW